MVEVFKTNIHHQQTAAKIKTELLLLYPDCKISFDLEDCDRILRIESVMEIGKEIELAVMKHGFLCEELF